MYSRFRKEAMSGMWRKMPAPLASSSRRKTSRKSMPLSRSTPRAIFPCSKFFLIGAAMLLGGCAVGPNYHRPSPGVGIPPAWGWKGAGPRDDEIKGEWWKAFQDPVLDG